MNQSIVYLTQIFTSIFDSTRYRFLLYREPHHQVDSAMWQPPRESAPSPAIFIYHPLLADLTFHLRTAAAATAAADTSSRGRLNIVIALWEFTFN